MQVLIKLMLDYEKNKNKQAKGSFMKLPKKVSNLNPVIVADILFHKDNRTQLFMELPEEKQEFLMGE